MYTKKITLIMICILNWNVKAQEEFIISSIPALEPITVYGPNKPVTNKNYKLAPTITPATQTICTNQAITNISSNPIISDATQLDCVAGIGGVITNLPNNGIFFDITNSGAVPLRINGLHFYAASTTNTTNVVLPFAIYKTTNASTGDGNYTNNTAWTQIGIYNFDLPASNAFTPSLLKVIFNDNGFTLAAGASVGFYIYCNNPNADGYRLTTRSAANSASTISNADLTVTHRVRATGVFQTDNQLRGFLGKILYNTGTFGYWSRNNLSNITGSTNAGDQISGSIPFPITGSLTNNTNTTEITTYTVTSYDVNGVKDVQNIYVTVETTPDSAVDIVSNTFTAVEPDANYQWFRCDPVETLISGATTRSYTATTSGQYKVRINKGPCEIDSECMSVTLNNDAFNASESFILYPNPANDQLIIKSRIATKVYLVNPLGQMVKTIMLDTTTSNEIKVNDINEGICFLKAITANNKTITKKIIIQH